MNKLKCFKHLTIIVFIVETFACQGQVEGNLFRHHEESREKLSEIESRMIPLPISTGTGSTGAFPSGIPAPELTCTGDDIHLYLHIKVDYFGNETHWDVKDVFENTIVHESTQIYKALGVYTHEFCLPCSRYIFTIYDDHGDGLYYPYGYIVKVNSELAKSSGLVLSEDEQSLTNDSSSEPFATFVGASDSVQFSGRCATAIDYFQIQSDHVENGVSYCLQARSKDQGAVIVAKPCTRTMSQKLQFWIVDSFGQIQNMADRTMCLAGGATKSRLTIEPCMTATSLTKERTLFIYNYFTKTFHYVKNAMRIIHMPNNLERSKVIRLRNMEVLPDSTSNAKRQWTIKFL